MHRNQESYGAERNLKVHSLKTSKTKNETTSKRESLKKGKPVDVAELETLADCLGGSIGLENKFTFDIVKNSIDDFVLISEEKIAEGIKLNFTEHRLVTEGAAATSIMVAKDNLSPHLGKNIICLICGGNIDYKLFSEIIS